VDACSQLKQSCSELDATTYQSALDPYGTGVIGYYGPRLTLFRCMQNGQELGYSCAEAFTMCV
jgi:hypothetical protein